MNTSSEQRIFTITHIGQIAVSYKEGQKLSFPKDYTDEKITWEINLKSGLQYTDLDLIEKNDQGELCFGNRMDGITFAHVLFKIKEVV